MIGPRERYQQQLQSKGFYPDSSQSITMDALDALYQDILTPPSKGLRGFFSSPKTLKGLYIWGGVGRGKSFMMDLFFDSLAIENKQRLHFHHFLIDIHQQLKNLPKSPIPMPIVARRIATTTRVLCLDEFFVDDIADAMLLVGLLPELFRLNVIVVATSNIAPDDLYLNGLQRLHFLQVIDEIKSHMQVIEIAEGVDYRMQLLEREGVYHVEGENGFDMEEVFSELSPIQSQLSSPLLINHRHIDVRAMGDGVVWFDFEAICATPRSSSDYIEIARSYHTVLVGGVPAMHEEQDDVAKRFMHFVDTLYDHRVKLVISAQVRPQSLYEGRRLGDAFQRTVSRLIEMSSHDYIKTTHRL